MESYSFNYKPNDNLNDNDKIKLFIKSCLQLKELYDQESNKNERDFFNKQEVSKLRSQILFYVDGGDKIPEFLKTIAEVELGLSVAIDRLMESKIPDNFLRSKVKINNAHELAGYNDRMLMEVIYAHSINNDHTDLLGDIKSNRNITLKTQSDGKVYSKIVSDNASFATNVSPQTSLPVSLDLLVATNVAGVPTPTVVVKEPAVEPPVEPAVVVVAPTQEPAVESSAEPAVVVGAPKPAAPSSSNPKPAVVSITQKLNRQNVILVGVHYNNDPSLNPNYTDIITSGSPYLERDDTLIIYNESFRTFIDKKPETRVDGFGDIIKYRSIEEINPNRTENIKALVFGVPTDKGTNALTIDDWANDKRFEKWVNDSLVAIVDAINNNPQIKYVLWSIRKTESSSSKRIDDIDDQKKIQLDLGLFNTEDRKGAKLVAKHITDKLFGLFDNRKYFFTGTIGVDEQDWVSDIFKNIFAFDPKNMKIAPITDAEITEFVRIRSKKDKEIENINKQIIKQKRERLKRIKEHQRSLLSKITELIIALSKELNAKEEYIYNNKYDGGTNPLIIQSRQLLKEALKKIIYVQTIKNEMDTFDLSITDQTQQDFEDSISTIVKRTKFDQMKDKAKQDINELLILLKTHFNLLYNFLSTSDTTSFSKPTIKSDDEIETTCINGYNLLRMMSGFKGDIDGCKSFSTNIDEIDYNQDNKRLISFNAILHPDRNQKCSYYATEKYSIFALILKNVEQLKEENRSNPKYRVTKDILQRCANNKSTDLGCNFNNAPDVGISELMRHFFDPAFSSPFDFGNFFLRSNFAVKQTPISRSDPQLVKITYGDKKVNATKVILKYSNGTEEQEVSFNINGTTTTITVPDINQTVFRKT